jgi:hypothetical protein
MPSEIKDKNAEPINEGDHVFARSRGGRHEGEVEKIVTSKEEAEKEGVKHPPKVCTGQTRLQTRLGGRSTGRY